jgi:hypothetical protein
MAFSYELFDRITDRLVLILETAEALHEGLETRVVVHKGVRRMGPETLCVYVFRAGVDDWGYWSGESGTDVKAPWALVCVAKHQGDPEVLEQLVARLTANVARVLLQHKQEPGYWTTAALQASDAVQFRDDKNQTYEMETVPVVISFSSSDD